ncbi:MAG: GNAT family N-acetyltransferase [Alphaproteobacteria bacterium]|nr:GNAT family N-acetyltransferase [Alphaproteobacteria bacterium]MBV9371178.1 GNAT family N-acetyltransferase [Alphaproteobacteria bacterium]MBV9901177.1 GNAT family N-acetyltransferase [Alphaproteobacteria bacterium]
MRRAPLNIALSALPPTMEEGFASALDSAAREAPPEQAFLRTAWFAAAGGRRPRTLVGRRADGRLLAALPTVAATAGLRAVPGGYWPWRSVPVAADAEPEELAAMLAHPLARGLGPAWRMGPQRSDDDGGARLAAAAPAAGWTTLTRRLGRTWLLDVARLRAAGGWPRGSTLRKNRFFEKHLSSHGALEFRFVTGSGWSTAVFDTFAAVERRAWIGTRTDGRDSKFLAPRHRRVWEEAAADPALAAMMWGSLLTVGGVPAAFGFDMDCGATRYCIANSYDPRFAKHSPGRVLAYRSFEHLDSRGVTLLDWGSGDPGYKAMMGAEEGPDVVDRLFVRNRALAALLRPWWEGRGQPPGS